jgi:cytochrome oxidase Cu insertion factor (SCO1/SenC/PrrC family)
VGGKARARQATRSRSSRRVQAAVAGSVAIAALLAVIVLTLGAGSAGGGGDGTVDAGTGTVDATQASVGKPFPDFTLTAVDGRPVTKASLAGRKAIVWFTDSTCVPCQLGAVQVARLDDQLGGEAFHVVAVFVNPAEPTGALRAWRARYARPDWQVALDEQGLANTLRLRYLDTKVLLDEHGMILDVDPAPVDTGYVRRLREAVGR